MTRIIVVGGGWAGCSASLAAIKAGADVVILERTDLLLGCGLAGGIMRNNGRYTASEELKCLGHGELIDVTDTFALHRNIDFPGHQHASLYNTINIEPMVRRLLQDMGVKICFKSRVTGVVKCNDRCIEKVILANGETIEGEVFIDATGSAGPMSNCSRYGNGCAMCVLRCPSYGPRVSLSRAAGLEDMTGTRGIGQYGSFSGSCSIKKKSLGTELRKKLEKDGVAIIPLPKKYINMNLLELKACHQYALSEYVKNIVLLDTGGSAKMMMPYCSLETLRALPGLEHTVYEHSNGERNSLRFFSRAFHNNTMKVHGLHNLFCGGEKGGFFVGHTEAMVTGSVAGFNAVRTATNKPCLKLPRNLTCGDIIAFENDEILKDKSGLNKRYTFAGGEYFMRMQELDLYSTNRSVISKRVEHAGLTNVFNGSSLNVDPTDQVLNNSRELA